MRLDEYVEPVEVGPFTVHVETDEYPDSPREWDNLGVMVCAHDRYDLGDEQMDRNWDERWPNLRNYLIAEHDALPDTIMPLYLFDHSGLSMSTDAGPYRAADSQGWDWGTVGVIFATPATVEMCGTPPELIREALAGEVETYDRYLRGEVYAYVVEDAEGNIVDSCCGFYEDEDYVMREGVEAAKADPAYARFTFASSAQLEGVGL